MDQTMKIDRMLLDSVPHWLAPPADCSTRYPFGNEGTTMEAPGCDNLFRALAEDPAAYSESVEALIAGPMAAGTLSAKMDAWLAYITPSIEADPKRSLADITASVKKIKDSIPALHARVRAFKAA